MRAVLGLAVCLILLLALYFIASVAVGRYAIYITVPVAFVFGLLLGSGAISIGNGGER